MHYLDMAGVLADFMRSAILAHGQDPDFVLSNWPAGTWSATGPLGLKDEDEFWEPIREDDYFWEDLAEYKWTQTLVKEVKFLDSEFQFATKPSSCRKCYDGKSQWVRELGFDPADKLIVIPDKNLLEAHDNILIDDNELNCDLWDDRGGHSILFPQPWNRNGSVEDKIEYVLERLWAAA